MDEETKRANKIIREAQKKRALKILWDHGWTEDEVKTALGISYKKIRAWNDERMKEWGQ